MSDAAVVRRVLSGDVEAYAVLVARYRDRLGRYAFHQLGNREDAEEAVQEAFVRAYRALDRCHSPERFGAWLFQILVNRCRTIGGRRGRRERFAVADEDALNDARVEHPADRLALGDAIRWALDQLPYEQREAFLLKHVEDLSYEQMAEITGAGISALKMRVKRACDSLRQLLAEVESV
ncbi:MAG: RNA polymerase sigma factor [Gemmatimonadales bacterium]|nr:ECF RNA polymerase sigma factor SigW [bacterium HR33]GIW53250.1 MAG: RNA polymerase sigma factor [Gemmatimonadales bacterium]